MSKVSRLLRSAQTKVPWLGDARIGLQRQIGRVLRKPVEEDFRALPLLGLPARPTCLDVGANRGRTIDAIRMFAPGARIEAFEPNPLLAARLQRRAAKDPDLLVRPVGLGDVAGTFTLHVPVYSGYAFDGLASFDREEASSWLEDGLAGFDEEKLEIRAVTCQVVRMDDLEVAPDFVKLDVQGFEHRALVGATATLERHHPALLIESPDEDSLELLAGLGYRPYDFDGVRLVPDRRQGLNTFFIAG